MKGPIKTNKATPKRRTRRKNKMYEVKIIKTGYANWVGPTKQLACGTISLIKGRKRIIVDTGNPKDKGEILGALKREGLTPEDINYVVCTHGHSDHIGNNNLFPNATFIVSYDISEGDLFTFHDLSKQPYKIDEGIEVISTPGHTHQDVSAIVKTASGTVAVVGDLFENEKDLEENSLWRSFSEFPDEHLKNREKILEIADFIIPGHGDMFQVKKKKKKFERRVNALKVSIPYHDNEGNPFEKERIKLVEDLFTILFGGFQAGKGWGEWKDKNGKIYPAKEEGHYLIELPAKPDMSQIEMLENLLRQWLDQKEIYIRLIDLKK